MRVEKFELSPPSLEELAKTLQAPLATNYEDSTVSIVECPDLQQAPFHLATEGLSGDEKIADVGGQPNLFPRPSLDKIWSLPDIAEAMDMDRDRGSLLGSGAGPFHVIGQNSELCANLGWKGGLDKAVSESYFIEVARDSGTVHVEKTSSCDCGLMINLFGSLGEPGPVLKITAGRRKGAEKSFTECIRKALALAYGDSRTISLGGVFLLKSGRANFHVMPDFPPEKELPFKNRDQLNSWLTYHEVDGPLVCLPILHSADPGENMGLRLEHTHGFSAIGNDFGGHYHYDIDGSDDVEYEAYLNTAKVLYRIDRPHIA